MNPCYHNCPALTNDGDTPARLTNHRHPWYRSEVVERWSKGHSWEGTTQRGTGERSRAVHHSHIACHWEVLHQLL